MIAGCSANSAPPPSIRVAVKCPPLAQDIVAESRAKPQILGDTGVEVSARLLSQMGRKNAALKRAVAAYRACRKA